jgi:LPS O-antigen subunit length determinant protein (WzzB/FepE family)
MTEKEQHSTTQSEQTQSFHDHAEDEHAQDEINLTDLMEVLIRKKILILSITSLFTLFSLFYIQSITPKYRVNIAFLDPQENFLSRLPDDLVKGLPRSTLGAEHNVAKPQGIRKSPPSAFPLFLSKVMSYKFQKEVFVNGNFLKKFYGEDLTHTIESAVLAIHKSIRLTKKEPDKYLPLYARPIFLTMTGTKPEVMSEFLTLLAETAIKNIAEETTDLILSLITAQISKYSLERLNIDLIDKIDRENKISHLSSALHIAKALGIKDNNLNVPFRNISNYPIWYIYGQKALEQELKKYKSTENTRVISKMTEEEINLNNYKALANSPMKIKVATISQPSIPPTLPFEPNKQKIITTNVILGLTLGIIMAFLRNTMERFRETQLISTKQNH